MGNIGYNSWGNLCVYGILHYFKEIENDRYINAN